MFKELKRIYNLLAGDMPLKNIIPDSEYEKYWINREKADEQILRRKSRVYKRMHLIAEEVEDNSNVLDIGCGNGDLFSIVHKKKTKL